MLSASMITNSKGNRPRNFSICWPTSYCFWSPVPLSPITAKRTDFDCSGSLSSGAGACARMAAVRTRNRKVERRISLSTKQESGYRVGDQIDDHISACVPENQIVPRNAMVKILRQLRQIQQQRGWHRLQRRALRIGVIDAELELDRLGVFQALLDVGGVRPLHGDSDQAAELGRDLHGKDIALGGCAPGFSNLVSEVALIVLDGLRRGGGLQLRQFGLYRVVQLHVSHDPILEILDERRIRIRPLL